MATRYVLKAVAKMEIKKVRWCGGQIGDRLLEYSYEKMSQIQGKDELELRNLVGEEKSKWLYNIALGICDEEVAEKGFSKSMMGQKTFRATSNMTDVNKFMKLNILDLMEKMSHLEQDHKVFPTSFVIGYIESGQRKS